LPVPHHGPWSLSSVLVSRGKQDTGVFFGAFSRSSRFSFLPELTVQLVDCLRAAVVPFPSPFLGFFWFRGTSEQYNLFFFFHSFSWGPPGGAESCTVPPTDWPRFRQPTLFEVSFSVQSATLAGRFALCCPLPTVLSLDDPGSPSFSSYFGFLVNNVGYAVQLGSDLCFSDPYTESVRRACERPPDPLGRCSFYGSGFPFFNFEFDSCQTHVLFPPFAFFLFAFLAGRCPFTSPFRSLAWFQGKVF